MKNLTLENIARVCGGTYYGPADKLQEEVMSVITDILLLLFCCL